MLPHSGPGSRTSCSLVRTPTALDAQVIQLNDLVVSIADMLRRTLGEHITLSTSLTRDVWSTRADPNQFQSAIVNMAVNARDAMPLGGKLVMETRNIVFDDDHADYLSELQPGEYVQLSISDTGGGMEAAIRDRVFEPFFTTKEKGRGTGLGLAMVYGFVKQSGGHVTIYSEPGHGTTINLYFPRSDAPSAATVASNEQDTRQPVRETILVVEDDSRVRQLTIRRLKLIGYEVLEASDGPAALQILRARRPDRPGFHGPDYAWGPIGPRGRHSRSRNQARHQSVADVRLCRRVGARRRLAA